MLDALHDSPIRLVSCRHEQGAANTAEAYGKLTGRPGICLVTRGPGATQAAVGVHTAMQDSTPLILLVGQVPRAFAGREAWQELDYAQVVRRHREGGVARSTAPSGSPSTWRARSRSRSRAGPARSCSRCPRTCSPRRPTSRTRRPCRAGPRVARQPRTSTRLRELLAACRAAARRSSARAAGRAETERRRARVLRGERAAGRVRVPLPGLRRQPLAALRRRPRRRHGRPAAPRGSRDADLVLAIGGRLGEVPTRRYTLLEPPRPRQTLVHVHPDPDELGRVYEPDLAIACGAARASPPRCAQLEPVEPRWRGVDARGARRLRGEPRGTSRWRAPVDLGEIMAFLRRRLPGDAIQTCGAGNFTVWAHRFAEFTQFGTQVCPRSGSMGYGVPAAVAAKLVHPGPDRRLLHRRRRLRDELARARDRRAVRAADRRRSS